VLGEFAALPGSGFSVRKGGMAGNVSLCSALRMTRLALFRYVGSHEETFAIDRSLWGSFGHRSVFCFPSLRSKDRLSRLHGSPGVLIARNPSVFFLTQYDSTDDTGNDVGLTDRLLIQRGREVGAE